MNTQPKTQNGRKKNGFSVVVVAIVAMAPSLARMFRAKVNHSNSELSKSYELLNG
jgi:hypothetical protein